MSTKQIKSIEADVRQSRERLANRWKNLELEVSGLASSAKEEVNQTFQQARETVSIRHQVEQRPWSMFGGAVLTGIAISRLSGFRSLAMLGIASPMIQNALTKERNSFTANQTSAETTSFKTSGDSEYGSLLQTVKNKAVSSLAEIAREIVKRNVPSSIAPIIDQAISQSESSLITKSAQKEDYKKSSARSPDAVVDNGDSFSIH